MKNTKVFVFTDSSGQSDTIVAYEKSQALSHLVDCIGVEEVLESGFTIKEVKRKYLSSNTLIDGDSNKKVTLLDFLKDRLETDKIPFTLCVNWL